MREINGEAKETESAVCGPGDLPALWFPVWQKQRLAAASRRNKTCVYK